MLGHRLWLAGRDRFDTRITLRGRLAGQPWSGLFDPERTIEGVDLLDDAALAAAFLRVRPEVVVNAAGLVKQRPAGEDPLANTRLNALLPHRVAALSAAAGARLIHLSTDCVFSGQHGGYAETDLPDPPDVYGRAKLLGEVAGPDRLTLRTSIVGRELAGRQGLVEWLVANRGGRVGGYTRAVFSGLTTIELAETVAGLVERQPNLSGVWHVAAPPIAKHDLLVDLNAALGLGIDIVPDGSVAIDRSLDDARFRAATGVPRPTWEAMVAGLAADPVRYDLLRGGA